MVSFLPAAVFAAVAAGQTSVNLTSGLTAALMFKNILYCLSFYFRYESLRIFGPFVGALMMGTQPIVIFVLGSILLGENLSVAQSLSMAIASGGLLLLASKDSHVSINTKTISPKDFGKYYMLPTLASALAIIWDRYFLRGSLSSNEFFILDRLLVVPAFALLLVTLRGKQLWRGTWLADSSSVLMRNWKSLTVIGILFALSVYTYNRALEIEKVALVSLVRNVSYPMAAFIGAFAFRHQISTKRWLSFSLVLLSVLIGAA